MDERETCVRWVRDRDELQRAQALRERVFCDEQGVSREEELDGLDDSSLHLIALAGREDVVIGTLRLRFDREVAHIGRLAVERGLRRLGVASKMLAIALERAREEGCERARLAAQLGAQGLYEHAGFAVESLPFEQAGIVHVWMEREL